MACPPGISLANERSHPAAISSLSGGGLPGTSVVTRPQSGNVSGIWGHGTPNDGSMASMNTGQQTDQGNQVSNPRMTIHTQYFVDLLENETVYGAKYRLENEQPAFVLKNSGPGWLP